jgi:hypothetical protein
MTTEPATDPRVHVSDDEIYGAKLFLLRLRNHARYEHREQQRRWTVRCTCGARLPCSTLADHLNHADILDRALIELEMRRRYDRPLDGLQRAKMAVDAAGGKYARPTQLPKVCDTGCAAQLAKDDA